MSSSDTQAVPADWEMKHWGDLVELVYGRAIGNRRSTHGSVQIYGTNGPTGELAIEAQAEGPTIVIGRKGAYRGVTWAPGPFWVIDTAFYARPRRELDLKWAFHALANAGINDLDSGSAIPSTRREDVYALPVLVPPIDEQGRIAEVLAAIDDKIKSNRRIAATLEEIAATLFKARFVDFVGQRDLVESEIGLIPAGWEVMPLSEAIEINPRVLSVKKGSVAPHVAMADVARWAVRPDQYGDREYSGGARFEPGDTLMARITGCIEHGKGAFIDFTDGAGAGSTEFMVMRARPPFTPEMVFLLSRSARVREHAIANMSGSSGRQRVPTGAFDHISMPVPPDDSAVAEEADVFRSVFAKTRTIWQQNRTLSSLRDALLPRLVSGQIRVPPDALPEEESV